MDKQQLLPKKIIEFSKEAQEDFALDELNIREKTLECATLKVKWLHKLFTEQAILRTAEERIEIRRQHIVDGGNANVPVFQRELDASRRDDIVESYAKIADQREVIRFVEGVLKIASGFNFELKSAIDYIKLSE